MAPAVISVITKRKELINKHIAPESVGARKIRILTLVLEHHLPDLISVR